MAIRLPSFAAAFAALALHAPPVAQASEPEAPSAEEAESGETGEARETRETRETSAPRAFDIEVGAQTGFSSAPIRGGTNPFGAGIGLRGGFAYSGWYLGGNLLSYFGGSDVNLSDHAVLYGIELGYGLRLRGVGRRGSLVLRPQFGVGDAAVGHTTTTTSVDVVSTASSSSSSSTSTTVTVHNLYLQPTLMALLQFDGWSFGRPFVSGSATMLILPGISDGAPFAATTWLSYGMRAEVGLAF